MMQTPRDAARIFKEVAVLLELKGESSFRIRAFQNATRQLEIATGTLEETIEAAAAGNIRGLGKALVEDLRSINQNGQLPFLLELRSEFPDGLLDLLKIPGLGAKKLKNLYETLEIDSLEKLEAACLSNQIQALSGFGKKTEANFLAGIKQIRSYSGQCMINVADKIAKEVCDTISESPHCLSIKVSGQLRRSCEVISSIELVAATNNSEELLKLFTSIHDATNPEVSTDQAKITLPPGIELKLHTAKPSELSSTLIQTTGNSTHIEELSKNLEDAGYSLSKSGLVKDGTLFEVKSEQEIYSVLELECIPAELREGRDEFTIAANKNAFSSLLQTSDIRGVLHAHSTYSDGKDTLKAMAMATKEQGYEYLGITDHSKSAAYAGGLSVDQIKQQHAEIDKLNEELAPFCIFKGIESDILQNGELDYDESTLSSFDFIVSSIHSRFSMSADDMTARLVNAIANPHTTILGHSTGRLLLKREPYLFDTDRILKACQTHGVAIEINANPRRLDLDWRLVSKASEMGIMIPICPDAHSIAEINYIPYGVGIARKGNLQKQQTLNTLGQEDLKDFFIARKGK
jgi:DNA polymerase (family 10)